ncbi:MAG: hypothetical protein E2O59_04880 [Gammaproteobacteria bacterium]|nr:MAG: hypothetical protein E2O59_04880 [Gammaproteobacteria bacterium]
MLLKRQFTLACLLGLVCTWTVDVWSADNTALEEIIVQAQKRTETQQEVPASFNVYTEANLESAGWDNITDIANTVPSIEVIGVTKTRTTLFIRSIGTNKFDIGTEGSVGVFVDGVYVPRFSSLMQDIFDVERVEVLKGPQGTLYGRNTIGGAISLYSKEPELAVERKLIAEVGSEGSSNIGATISGAFNDKWYGSAAISRRERGGYRKDLVSGKSDDEEVGSARIKLLYIPTDSFETSLTAYYSDQYTDAFLGEPLSPTGEVFAISPLITQQQIDAVLAEEAKDTYSSSPNLPGFTEVKSLSTALTLKYFSDDLNIESITGFRDEVVGELVDNDRISFDILEQHVTQNSKTWSEEFKIFSESGGAYTMDDKWEWLAGVFLYRDEAERDDLINVGADSVAGLLAFAPFFSPAPYPLGFLVELETQSWAVFGQATYMLNDEWSMTLGGRYSKDKKDFTYTGYSDAQPAFVFTLDNFSFDDSLEFSSADPKLVIKYAPEDLPDFNAYFSYAQGYKSGGIQYIARRLATAQDSFDKEILKATEIGIKSRWLGQSLQVNASVYHYDYTDQQIQAIVDAQGATQIITSNAGSSTIIGFEADIMYQLTSDLLLQTSYSYMDAEFDEFMTPDGLDRSGNVLPAAPKHSVWVSGQYNHFLDNGWEVGMRLDYSWRDDQVFTPDGAFGQDAYGLMNTSITLTSPADVLSVRAFCNNCTNEEYTTSIIPLSQESAWAGTGGLRYYGVSASYRF